MASCSSPPSAASLLSPAASLETLAAVLEHQFRQPELLREALTHPSLPGAGLGRRRTGRRKGEASPSASAESGAGYERLEFLGDRVLGLLIAEWLLEKFPTEAEGALSQRLSALVRRESLSVVALELDLGQHLHLSPGEENCGGRSNQSILADACEAVIGALYLDGGLDQARRFVRRYWAGLIERIERPPQDHKTRLQEWAQSRGHPLPVYRILSHTGPAHRPEFVIAVEVSGFPPAEGIGGSRRAAEQAAAAILLERHAPSPFFQALDHAPRR